MTLSKEDVEKALNIKITDFEVDESNGFKLLKLHFTNEWTDKGYAACPLERWDKECTDEEIINGLKHGVISHSCRGKSEKTETPIMGDLLDYDRDNHLGRCRDILDNIRNFISNLGLDNDRLEDKIRMEVTSKFRGANGSEVNAWCKEIYGIDISDIDSSFWKNMADMYFDLAEDNEHFLESTSPKGTKISESEELKEDPILSDPEKEMSEENPEKKAEDTKFEEPGTFNECNEKELKESKDTKYIVKIGKEEKEYDKKGEASSAFLKALDDNDSKVHCYLYKVNGKTRAVLGHDTGNKKLKESEELKEDPILAKPEDEMSIVDPEKKEEITAFVEPKTFNPEECASIFEESKKLQEDWFKDRADWFVCKIRHGRPIPCDVHGALSRNAIATYDSENEANKARQTFESNPSYEGQEFIVTNDPNLVYE